MRAKGWRLGEARGEWGGAQVTLKTVVLVTINMHRSVIFFRENLALQNTGQQGGATQGWLFIFSPQPPVIEGQQGKGLKLFATEGDY